MNRFTSAIKNCALQIKGILKVILHIALLTCNSTYGFHFKMGLVVLVYYTQGVFLLNCAE